MVTPDADCPIDLHRGLAELDDRSRAIVDLALFVQLVEDRVVPEGRPAFVHHLRLALRIEVLRDLADDADDLALPRLEQRRDIGERAVTHGRVHVADLVVFERVKTNGSVVARIVLKQGLYSYSGIKNTVNVIAQNTDPQSSICTAASIGKERVATDGCVGLSGSIVDERANAIRSVPGTSCVA